MTRFGLFTLSVLVGLLSIVLAFVLPIVALFGSAQRAWNAIVGVDQTLNALTGGSEDQTVSGRAYQAQGQGKAWGCILCKVLDLFDPGHCERYRDS